MIDALSIVGLAGNIAQFIAYGFNLFGKASEIRKSADGALKNNWNIELIVQHLKSTLGTIKGFKKSESPELNSLQDACAEVIDELLRTLEEIKPTDHQKKWQSFKAALKTIGKEDKIEAWINRLRDFRGQFNMHVEVYILENIELAILQHTKGFDQLQGGQKQLIEQMERSLREGTEVFGTLLDQKLAQFQESNIEEHRTTRRFIQEQSNQIQNELDGHNMKISNIILTTTTSTRETISSVQENLSIATNTVSRSATLASSRIENLEVALFESHIHQEHTQQLAAGAIGNLVEEQTKINYHLAAIRHGQETQALALLEQAIHGRDTMQSSEPENHRKKGRPTLSERTARHNRSLISLPECIVWTCPVCDGFCTIVRRGSFKCVNCSHPITSLDDILVYERSILVKTIKLEDLSFCQICYDAYVSLDRHRVSCVPKWDRGLITNKFISKASTTDKDSEKNIDDKNDSVNEDSKSDDTQAHREVSGVGSWLNEFAQRVYSNRRKRKPRITDGISESDMEELGETSMLYQFTT